MFTNILYLMSVYFIEPSQMHNMWLSWSWSEHIISFANNDNIVELQLISLENVNTKLEIEIEISIANSGVWSDIKISFQWF